MSDTEVKLLTPEQALHEIAVQLTRLVNVEAARWQIEAQRLKLDQETVAAGKDQMRDSLELFRETLKPVMDHLLPAPGNGAHGNGRAAIEAESLRPDRAPDGVMVERNGTRIVAAAVEPGESTVVEVGDA